MRIRLPFLCLLLSCADGPSTNVSWPAYQPNPPTNTSPLGTPPSTPGSLPPGCGRPAAAGVTTQHVQAANRARTYLLVVPEGYNAQTPYPLVMVLHGGGGNAAGARAQTDLEKVASGKAVFVYPEGGGSWDLDSPASTNGDVALFDAILLATHNNLCVDPKRVFLTGFSNGAYMANQLACRRGERIRGIVTHAGGGPYETHGTYDATGRLQCPGKAVAALIVHGNSDHTVLPSEGDKSIAHWTYANRCTTSVTSAYLPPCTQFQGCFQPVGTCRIPGLGHGLWPNAGRVTWTFFSSL